MNWVGYLLTVDKNAKTVTAQIKPELLQELLRDTLSLKKRNTITYKALRSYTRRVNHVAHLIRSWKPFTDQLWAAIETEGKPLHKTLAPPKQVWTR